MALKNVELNSSVITSTTTLAVDLPACTAAARPSRHWGVMWVAPSRMSRRSKSQFKPVRASAPNTPTAPDSDGVAMPWKIDTSTPRMSTTIGTMAMSTSHASIRVNAMMAKLTISTSTAATAATRRFASSITHPTMKPSKPAMSSLVWIDGLPSSLRSSSGMAGPMSGFHHDTIST